MKRHDLEALNIHTEGIDEPGVAEAYREAFVELYLLRKLYAANKMRIPWGKECYIRDAIFDYEVKFGTPEDDSDNNQTEE